MMMCTDAPTSNKIVLMLSVMAATFSTVFIIVFFPVNKIQENNEPIIPPIPTPPPSSTNPPIPDPIDAEHDICPRPSTNIEDLKWGLKGDAIKGKVVDNDLLRQPVAISHDGHTVVLGAPWGYYGTTTVDVLKFIGGSWQEEKSFSGSGEDEFGESISLSGDGNTLAIGVRWSDEGGENSGHVEVFERKEEDGWKPKGNKILGLEAGDNFGSSVSLNKNGNKLAVGAHWSLWNQNGYDSGSTQVYQFQNEDWVQMGQVIPGEAKWDEFGRAVSLSADGNIVAIGAPLAI